ncbi:hypothetical protein DACRYDRAFT_116284 [Dacryopinax primogenitus]|uniref:DUF6533 domain-containing protein n=1 Tax=Dacryopinax primogenitus (strain DJM 731) TaxID=1858805 RepID=M5GCL7_DACPD|nr:uncharacterized protein DACRYDRAFT_116284 [Dacryopinax primogenitus]EJU01848.1 hypothetical protein DACRYDRAFT_116284 [Dacryopinax primogenitus]
MDTDEQAEIAALIVYAQHTQITNYFTVASFCLFVYDWIITLPLEAKYVWPSPWSLGKVLFLLTRYLALIDTSVIIPRQLGNNLSTTDCQILYQWSTWSMVVGVAIADIILAMRTWAIWSRSRAWGFLLAFAWFSVYSITFGTMGKGMSGLTFGLPPDPALKGCFIIAAGDQGILFIGFVVIMVFDLFTFTVTAIKGIDHIRRGDSALVSVLYRDGLLFSAVLCVISVLNIIVLEHLSSDLFDVLVVLFRSVHAILACRIMLHIRDAAGRELDQTTAAMELTAVRPPARGRQGGTTWGSTTWGSSTGWSDEEEEDGERGRAQVLSLTL